MLLDFSLFDLCGETQNTLAKVYRGLLHGTEVAEYEALHRVDKLEKIGIHLFFNYGYGTFYTLTNNVVDLTNNIINELTDISYSDTDRKLDCYDPIMSNFLLFESVGDSTRHHLSAGYNRLRIYKIDKKRFKDNLGIIKMYAKEIQIKVKESLDFLASVDSVFNIKFTDLLVNSSCDYLLVLDATINEDKKYNYIDSSYKTSAAFIAAGVAELLLNNINLATKKYIERINENIAKLNGRRDDLRLSNLSLEKFTTKNSISLSNQVIEVTTGKA